MFIRRKKYIELLEKNQKLKKLKETRVKVPQIVQR